MHSCDLGFNLSFAVLWLTFHMTEYHLFMQDFISPILPLFIYSPVVPIILLIACLYPLSRVIERAWAQGQCSCNPGLNRFCDS